VIKVNVAIQHLHTGGQAVMQQHDGAGTQSAIQTTQNTRHRRVHRVKASAAPHQDSQPQGLGCGMTEEIVMTDRRAEPALLMGRVRREHVLALRQLTPDAPWSQAPKGSRGVRHAVISDAVPAPQDLSHERWLGFGAVADQEEQRLRLMPVKHLQQRRRDGRIRSVVDGDEHAFTRR